VDERTSSAADSGFDLLPWDSDRFGFSVARVRTSVTPEGLENVVQQMRTRDVVLAYYALPDERHVLSDRVASTIGARLVDTRVVFRAVLAGRSAPDFVHTRREKAGGGEERAALGIRSFREREVGPELIQLARAAGRFSRFRVDPRVDPRVFHEIYDAWLLRSVRREIADEVFVGSTGGRDIGLVTVAIANDGACIGLLSVSDSVRGRGFGRALTERAFAWASEHGCRELRVATQLANAAACAMYSAVGCSVESRVPTYHIWLA
jgi:dTDP-4-amino-4,6-dideoxy-D-galactose acyltransferase